VDPLEIVSSTGDAAFATDEHERIVIWNKAAEKLFGFKAESVLGKRCWEVLCGRDVFGNCFCDEDCAVQHMARQKKAINRFQMEVRQQSGALLLASFSILVVPGVRPSRFTLVHLFQPVDHSAEPHASARHPPAGAPAPPPVAPTSLTGRETQVLRMLSEGVSTQEIAEMLFISLSTTRNHIQHILQKLGVHSKLEAVAAALRTHLI